MAGKKSKTNASKNNRGGGVDSESSSSSAPLVSLTAASNKSLSNNSNHSERKSPAITASATANTKSTENDDSTVHVSDIMFYLFLIIGLSFGVLSAYHIRLKAIEEFGPVIHEFDPYFNYRATEVS